MKKLFQLLLLGVLGSSALAGNALADLGDARYFFEMKYKKDAAPAGTGDWYSNSSGLRLNVVFNASGIACSICYDHVGEFLSPDEIDSLLHLNHLPPLGSSFWIETDSGKDLSSSWRSKDGRYAVALFSNILRIEDLKRM